MATTFRSRTEAPSTSDSQYYSGNPFYQAGYGLPNCTAYAFGRFWEILGTYPKLCTRDAWRWWSYSDGYQRGSTPKLGAVAVFKQEGQAGHVAIVEDIFPDGSITLSESGWGSSRVFWTSKQYPPNYYSSSFQLLGFIYNPAVPDDAVSSQFPYDAAQAFVQVAVNHIGPDGHNWVKANTAIGGQPWCAATVCAVAKEAGVADVIMPGGVYGASRFGQLVVEQYGGSYIPGHMMGVDNIPQVGDLIEFQDIPGVGSNGTRGQFASRHIAIVWYVEGDHICCIEGNVTGDPIMKVDRPIHGAPTAWFARPDWSKVGGTRGLTTFMGMGTSYGISSNGTPLYTSKSTRADAALREVCYIDLQGKPSISSTGIRLSVINYTSLLGGIVDLLGGANTTSTNIDGTVDTSGITNQNARIICDYLINKGLTAAMAVGFLANIKRESEFKTDEVNSSSGAAGICQWLGSRKQAMIAFVGSNWRNNLSGQLDYLWSELTGIESRTLSSLRSQITGNDSQSAQDAANVVLRVFERPENQDHEEVIRRGFAAELWKQIVVNVSSGTSSAINTTQSGVIRTQSGRQVTSGNAVVVPGNIQQSGLISEYTYYDRNWSSSSRQRVLYNIWVQSGKPHNMGVATLGGCYLVAVSPIFGTIGDIITVQLEDGKLLNCIVGDAKGADAQSPYGHVQSSGISIIEWEAFGDGITSDRSGSGVSHNVQVLNQYLTNAGLKYKKVSQIVNRGTWLQ